MQKHTHAEAEALARALQRAHARGLAVVGKGTCKDGGAPVYAVTSSSQPGRWHLVMVVGLRLVCDCQAGHRGLMCQHRALVRERITAERARIAARTAQAAVSHGTRSAPAHPGDTALMRRSNRPFSLLK